MTNKENRRVLIGLAVIGVVFLVTRLLWISQIPRGYHVDEAGMAYDAFCLANYGVERHLIRFPVYLTNYGSGQSALYAYLAAFCIRILGFCPTAFRLPAVCAGAAAVGFGYLIGRETMGKRQGLCLAALITICPYFIMASRWGLDCNLLMGFFTMSVYWLMHAVKRGHPGWFCLAGASFGITLYTYAVSYVLLPPFLLLSLLYLLWNRKLNGKQVTAFVIPLLLLALPLLLFLLVNMEYLEPITTPLFTIHRLEYYRGGEFSLANIPANRNLFRDLLSSDFLPYNAFGQFGTLYYISVPFLLLGVAVSLVRAIGSIRRRHYDEQTYVAFMFWVIVAVDMVMMLPNINKSNAIYFPFIYFVVLAMDALWHRLPRVSWKRAVTVVVAVAYLGCFLRFGNYYYFQYSEDVYPQRYFNDSLVGMLDLIEETYPDGNRREIYVDDWEDNVSQPYIYTLIRRPLHPEEWMQIRQPDNSYRHYHFSMPETPDECGIYIMYANWGMMEQLEQAGFVYETFNEHWRIYSNPSYTAR